MMEKQISRLRGRRSLREPKKQSAAPLGITEGRARRRARHAVPLQRRRRSAEKKQESRAPDRVPERLGAGGINSARPLHKLRRRGGGAREGRGASPPGRRGERRGWRRRGS